MARLEVIIGNMFSGKSTELIRRVKRHRAIGHTVLVFNSSKDTRDLNDVVKTHDSSTIQCIKTAILDSHTEHDVIVVDEAQFFTGLRDFVEQALAMGKHVIVAGLDGDFQQMKFGEILDIIPLEDEVVKLTALCMDCIDGTPGPFTKRMVHGTEQELVGAAGMYKAVCRKHIL